MKREDLEVATDAGLLSAFRRERCDEAFRELMRRYFPMVFGVALRRLDSRALAEEAAQNAFVRLAEKVAVVARHPERLRGWLHQTAWREANNLARKEGRHARRVREVKSVERGSGAEERPEVFDRLDEALGRLSGLDRELVLRRYCGGEEYARIARAVGRSPTACQKRVERALARLARVLGGGKVTPAVVAGGLGGLATGPAGRSVAEHVAGVVLERGATGLGWVGSGSLISGTKAAGYLLLALSGGVVGWHRERPESVVVAPLSAQPTMSPARLEASGVAPDRVEEPLGPRRVRVERTLDEVLETIQAGRFAPLVEFLPEATAEDLQAIIAEDDIGMYGEVDAQDHFGSARNLALSRWVEIDPQGAFRFAVARDGESGHGLNGGMGDASAVVEKWLRADPRTVVSALQELSPYDRVALVQNLSTEACDEVAALMPELAWLADQQREKTSYHPGGRIDMDEADRLVSELLAGRKRGVDFDVLGAFRALAKRDPEDALTRARLIRDPELQAQMLLDLYRDHPPHGSALAPGKARTNVLAAEIGKLARTDPEAAIRRMHGARPGPERKAAFTAIVGPLGRRDPFRLLEVAASLPEPVGWVDLDRALEEAGRRDPRRALELLPGLLTRVSDHEGAEGFAKPVLLGWLRHDPAGAIRMAAELGLYLGGREAERLAADPEPLIGLLGEENESARFMARQALSGHFRASLIDDAAAELLARMPPDEADLLVCNEVVKTAGKQGFDEAMRLAELASPEGRRATILPEVARRTYRLSSFPGNSSRPDDPAGTVAWVRSLPAEDREAVVAGVKQVLENLRPGPARERDQRLLEEIQR